MTHGGLFSGVGGFSLGFERVGIKTIWECELDKNCRKLLARKHAKIHDNVETFNPDEFECPSIISFGSPCQDLSVAGRRAGMAGNRSGLFYEATRIIRGFVGRGLEFAVWENVPGAFSSNGGRDFAGVLRELAKCGALDVAWRVLDAQWFNVAQRRQRLFLVADFRAERAAEILSLSEGLRGDPAPGRDSGEGIAPTISARTKGGGGLGTDFDLDGGCIPEVADCLQERDSKGPDSSTKNGHLIPIAFSCKDHGADAGAVAPTLRAMTHRDSHMNGGGQVAIAFDPTQITSPENRCNPQHGDPCHPLSSTAHPPAIAFSGRERGAEPAVGRAPRPPHAIEEAVGALDATKPWNVAFNPQAGGKQNDLGCDPHSTPTLSTSQRPAIASQFAVRRLTPTECERLMGFPDGHTAGFADTVRYRMCGNAVVATVAAWIGRRLLCHGNSAS